MLQVKSFPCERIKLRCTQCHARLCDRLKTNDGWILHYKKAHTTIYTNWMILTCECRTSHQIDAQKGILKSLRNDYDDPGIQPETSEPADGGQ